MGLISKSVGKMQSIMRRLENQLLKEKQLHKEKKDGKEDKKSK